MESAARELAQDLDIEPALRTLEVDRDTKGVSGSPPIVDTIFRKIDEAAIFVGDMTFVGKRADGRPTPNPNVLIEYGWALKSLSHGRVVTVVNVSHGMPTAENMPFNMRHLRHPIQYECPVGADEAARGKARIQIAKALKVHPREVLASNDFRRSLPKPPEPLPFETKPELDGPGRFRAPGEPLGIANVTRFTGSPLEVRLWNEPAMWLRVMPAHNLGMR